MYGFLIVDPSTLITEQVTKLRELVRIGGGWQHPDGIRWIFAVDGPSHVREKLVKEGWPVEAVEVAH